MSASLHLHLDAQSYLILSIASLVCSVGTSLARFLLRQHHWWDRNNRSLVEPKPDELSWISFAFGVGATLIFILYEVKR